MFVIIFRPGPKENGEFKANINSYGHAPLLFVCVEALSGKGFWVDKFTNATVFDNYNQALELMSDAHQLAALALRKMHDALLGAETLPVHLEGVLAVMPLAFATSVTTLHVEAE